MKFRLRQTTNYLYVHLRNTEGLTVQELQREARRSGLLALGYHYVIQRNGDVEIGRETYEIAGHDFENAEKSIYVLVDYGAKEKLTDSQMISLKDLKESIEGEYKGIKIIVY